MVSVLGFVGRSFGYVLDSLWPAPAVQHANHLADFEAMIETHEPRCGTCHQELDADGECAWERLVEAAATTPAAVPPGVDAEDSPPSASPGRAPLNPDLVSFDRLQREAAEIIVGHIIRETVDDRRRNMFVHVCKCRERFDSEAEHADHVGEIVVSALTDLLRVAHNEFQQ